MSNARSTIAKFTFIVLNKIDSYILIYRSRAEYFM